MPLSANQKKNSFLLVSSMCVFLLFTNVCKADSTGSLLDFHPDILKDELPDSLSRCISDAEKKYSVEFYAYQSSNLEHRSKTFAWQLFASKIIFIIVMIIVLSGLVLSYLHFYKSLSPAGVLPLKQVSPTDDTVQTEQMKQNLPVNEIEISLTGIKINSSIIGLIILVISIAFLYMYLIYVFPIKEVTIDTIMNAG